MKDGQRSFIEHIETLFDAGAIGEQTDRQLLERFTGRDRGGRRAGVHGPGEAARADGLPGLPRDPPRPARQPRTRSRRRSSSWPARRRGSGSAARWAPGSCRSPAASPRPPAPTPRADALHERKAAELAAPAADVESWDDRDAILHEELGRLPEKYRTAVVLCDLEGLTQEQAARHLGWPDGTVRSRLARGREQLRDRLTRRGLAPAAILAGSIADDRCEFGHHWWRRLSRPPWGSRRARRRLEPRRRPSP